MCFFCYKKFCANEQLCSKVVLTDCVILAFDYLLQTDFNDYENK